MPGSLGRPFDPFDNTDIGEDDSDDALTGSAANDRLLGLGGNDQLDGGDDADGLDRFVVGLDDGDDTLAGFDTAQVIDLSGTGISNFADLLNDDSDDGALATLVDGEALTFRSIGAAELSAVNFLFAEDGAGAGDDAASPLPGDDAGDAGVLVGDTGTGIGDLIDLGGVIDVTAFDGLDAAETRGGEGPTFEGIAAADLAADSFIFAEDGAIVLAGTDGDDILTGSDASDTFLVEPDGGDDTIIGLQQDDLLDPSAFGLASFDALDVQDTDDGSVLAVDDGTSVTFDGLDAADLDALNFLLDT